MAAFQRFVAVFLILPLLFFGTPSVAWGAKQKKEETPRAAGTGRPDQAANRGQTKPPRAPQRLDYEQYTDTQNNVAIDAFVMRGREGILKTEFISRPPGLGRLKSAQLISPEGVVYAPQETFDVSEQAARNLGRLQPAQVPTRTGAPTKKKSKLGALAVGTALTALSSLASGPRVSTTVDEAGHAIVRETRGVSPATGIVAGLTPALVATQAGRVDPQEGVPSAEIQTVGTGHFSSVAEFSDPPPMESQMPWLLKVMMEIPDGTILAFTYYLNPLHFISGPPAVVEAARVAAPPEEAPTAPAEEETEPPTEEEARKPPEEVKEPPTEEAKPPSEEEQRPPEEEEKPPEEEDEEPPVTIGGFVSVPREGPGTVPPGEGTKPPDEGWTPPDEEPPIIIMTPPEEIPPCCEKRGESILFPITSDPLSPPPVQEAYENPAIGAYKVFLHDGSLYEQEHEFFVESAGVDFDQVRSYRSNIATEDGGLFGHKWDLNFNKRILPLGGFANEAGIKAEPASNPGNLLYYNGDGRGDIFAHISSQDRNVKNFRQIFRAFVSTYKPPAGLFVDLKRYVVYPGFPVPFSEHPNFEGRLFYVLRYKDGTREIFNCRGQLIYYLDRHENKMTFVYSTPLHPLTMNPILKQVTDTAGRTYILDWIQMGKGLVFTFYRGRTIRSPEPKMRLKSITDRERRKVVYEYQNQDTVPVLEAADEQMDNLQMVTRYTYEGDHLLKTIKNPRESATRQEPFLTNHWQGKEVARQTVGREGMGSITRETGEIGGEWKIKSGENSEIIDRENHLFRYHLKRVSESFVVDRREEPLDDGSYAITHYKHNGDYQIKEVELPEGNFIFYDYDEANETVTQGDVRDWLDAGVTYENNLTKGNLILKRLTPGRKQNELPYGEIKIGYEYEDLFNEVKRMEGPGDAVTEYRHDHGWYATPGNNGNPVSEKHPQRTRAEGEPLRDILTTYTYKPQGMVETILDPLGHLTTFAYQDRTGYLLSVTSPDGNMSYGRDLRGNITSFTDERGMVTRFEVNQRDLVDSAVIDEGGFENETHYQYDLNRNLIEEKRTLKDNFPAGREFENFERRPEGELTITYESNLLNRLVKETHKAGELERSYAYAYDKNENVVRITSPLALSGEDINAFVEFKYDARGLLKEKVEGGASPQRIVETYSYDKNGKLSAKTIGGEGEKTRFETDAFDRPFKTVTPLGTEIKEFRKPTGTVFKVEVRGKNHEGEEVKLFHTEFTYDEFNSLIKTEEKLFDLVLTPTGRQPSRTKRTKYVRDEEGKTVKIIEEGDYTTTIDYTGTVHRKYKETDPLGNEVIYTYAADGEVTSITENEKELVYAVSRGGRQPRATPRTQSYVTLMDHDSFGRLISFTDPGQHTTLYAHDSEGHLCVMKAPEERFDLHEYDGLGRKVRMKEFANAGADALLTVNEYDLNDRLLSSDTERGGQTIHRVAYEYFPTDSVKHLYQDGRVYQYRYDGRGNLTREAMPNGIDITRGYDEEDRLKRVEVGYHDTTALGGQHGSRLDTFEYDGMGRVTKAEAHGGFVVNKMTYNSFGLLRREEQIVGGRGFAHTHDYNLRGLRESTVTPALPNLPSQTFRYHYDELGRLHRIENLARLPREEISYDYSGTSRLARRTLSGLHDLIYEYNAERELRELKVFNRETGEIPWQSTLAYAEHRPSGFDAHLALEGNPTDNVAVHDFLANGTEYHSIARERIDQQRSNTILRSAVRRVNLFEGGRLAKVLKYFQTSEDRPGFFGRSLSQTVLGEKMTYLFQGNRIQATKFEHFDGLGKDLNFTQIERAMGGEGTRRQFNRFRYDQNGNILEDDRYYYGFDYRDRLNRAIDKWDLGRGFSEEANYFYDYLNRLVYVAHEPSDQRDVRALRTNVRILYDGGLPAAELGTDFSGIPNALNAFYVTHPEGEDLGRVVLRVWPGTRLEEYLPFFSGEGALVYFANQAGEPQKTGYEFEAPNRRARLKHVISGRRGTTRIEVPMTSLATRWEPFSEMNVLLQQGRFIFDASRNLDQQWLDIVDLANQAMHERITSGHKSAMLALGVGFLPFLLASPWVAVFALADVAIDYGIQSLMMGQDYSIWDALLAFEMGVAFAGMGLSYTALKTWTRPTVAQIILQASAGRVTTSLLRHASKKELLEAAFRSESRAAGGAADDLAERAAYWMANREEFTDQIMAQAKVLLKEVADSGNRWARDLLDDLTNNKIRIVFKPEMKQFGYYRQMIQGVLFINPLRRGRIALRDMKELTATMLHEYVHRHGYNEFRAHWEQYVFLMRLASKRSLLHFPEMGGYISAFAQRLKQGGIAEARRFMVRHIHKNYVLTFAGKPVREMLDTAHYRGGKMVRILHWYRQHVGSAKGML